MIEATKSSEGKNGLIQPRSTIFERRLSRKWTSIAVVVLTLFAFGIRLHNLTLDSFWIDELNTIWTSNADTQTILNVRDHPPLLYFLTKASTTAFGESEFSGRLPSLLASLPAISLIVVIGRVFRHPLAGMLAAFMLALSPFHIRHAQEARHYAMFMTVSLATYLLLYLAIKKPTVVSWLGYALVATLNLYIHYGAIVVLGVQSLLIAGWSLIMIWRRRYRRLLFPAAAALSVILLYVVRVPQLKRTVDRTFADVGGVRHNEQADLLSWLKNLYPTLSTTSDILAPLLLGLCLIGFGILLYRRQWTAFAFSAVGLIMPLVLISITGADRTSNPRYVIHLLPWYLLMAAIALTEFLHWPSRRARPAVALVGLAGVTGLLVLVSLPLVQAEYETAMHDWRNIADALEERGEDGDVVVAMTLSLSNGYNVAGDSMRYYLDRGQKEFHLLQAAELVQGDIEQLAESVAEDADVWGVVMHWGSPFEFEDDGVDKAPFKGFTHLTQDPSFAGRPLVKILRIYEQLLPLANAPYPHCLLKQDMAIIRQNMGDLLPASILMAESFDECPEAPNQWLEARRPSVLNSLIVQLRDAFEEAKAGGEVSEIRELAMAIFMLQTHDEEALAYLEFANLLEMFDQGHVQVESTAPEPVSRASFGMPPNNYEGDVLFLHPPSRVTYELALPEEPTVFQTRIAMVPDSWEWGGDGSTFVVLVETNDSDQEELFRQYISNEPNDRHWHLVEVPLGNYAGQEITLTLLTDPGPAGSEMGDWAIWDRPAVWWETGMSFSDQKFN